MSVQRRAPRVRINYMINHVARHVSPERIRNLLRNCVPHTHQYIVADLKVFLSQCAAKGGASGRLQLKSRRFFWQSRWWVQQTATLPFQTLVCNLKLSLQIYFFHKTRIYASPHSLWSRAVQNWCKLAFETAKLPFAAPTRGQCKKLGEKTI